MNVLRLAGVLFLCGIASGFGQANQSAFFRILSPSSTVISGFDQVAGTLTFSNAVAGTTNQLQRSYNLSATSNWVDFVLLTSDTAIISETIISLNPPEGMAFIPSGSFQMGDSFSEGNLPERPVHSVYVSGFYMGKTEVTKAQWDEVYNWATNNSYSFDHAGSGKAPGHPVHTVSWNDCVKWCNARSEKEGRTPCYSSKWDCNYNANGYRLPTEAEWEKASRGGLNGKRFPWGNVITRGHANYYSSGYSYDTGSPLGYHPAYDIGGFPNTSPVGSFSSNAYGLYDMSGNVWEWCGDWYGNAYYASSPSTNPRGASSGSYRTTRGGSWEYDVADCRLAMRYGLTPSDTINRLGFRVCLSVD